MYSTRFRFLCAAIIILMAMLACNMPFVLPAAPMTSTMTPAPAHTQTKATTESVTLTETLTPEPSLVPLTPTAEIPVAEVVKESNCRVGPGGAYDLVLTFKAGDKVEI